MIHINESTKKVFMFLVVVFCGYLIFVFSSMLIDDSDNELNISKVGENEIKKEIIIEKEEKNEKLIESLLFTENIAPDYIRKNSMKIKLERVYIEEDSDGDYILYFDVIGEDIFIDEQMSKESGNFFFRSPFSWYSSLQYHRDDTRALLICDYDSEGRFWNTTYCISLDELTKDYFKQTTRFVYTDKSLADIERFTPLALMKQKRTFVFEVVLPKEFYDKIV